MLETARKSLNRQTAIIIYSNIVVYFDFLIYFYLADTLSLVFFPSTDNPLLAKIQFYGLFAAGYLARPIGALFIGRYGDVKGRKTTFKVTSIFIVATSCITAFLPTYAQIGLLAPIIFVLVRLAQGMGFAAHSVLGWVYISEHVPKKSLGLYVSIISASFLVGALLTTLLFKLILSSFSPSNIVDYVWRLVFIGSALFGLLSLFLSRYLKETPFFLEQEIVTNYIPNYKDIDLSYGRFHATFLSFLCSFQLASFMIVIVLLLPQLIALNYVVDIFLVDLANSVAIIFFILGVLFYGVMADKGHIGKALMLGSLFVIVQVLIFFYTIENMGNDYMIITYAMLGFSGGVIALAPIMMLQLFPTKERLTSVAIIYNTTYAVAGGILPLLLIYATGYVAFAPALYIVFISIIGFITGQYITQAPKFSYLNRKKDKQLA